MIEIPGALANQVRDGNAVVFLGAGASREAQRTDGTKCPTAAVLTEKLADKFLGGKFKNAPLNQVAEYAISETDLMTVQDYIRSLFLALNPTAAHLKLPLFNWYALATTNYDMILEDAFESGHASGQILRPLIENSDRVDENLRSKESVLYVKLHGCISRINNASCPLILTTDQYIEHRKGRARLFDVFRTWGYEHPIIFIGQSLQDTDLRTIILELTQDLSEFRPRHYLVAPDVDEIRSRYWETKKITAIKADFDSFMSSLDAAIPSSFRHIAVISGTTREHEIERRFKVKSDLSKPTLQFLTDDVDYINSLASVEQVRPDDFYRGYSSGFGPIEQGLDVRRKLGDSILSDYVLQDREVLQEEIQIVLIKAHAGAGKSILLKRIAWDAAKDYDRITLFLRPQGTISVAALKELISYCKERVYLFIDNAADRTKDIQAICNGIGLEGRLLTLILAERTNEWNIAGQKVNALLSDEYELRYLSMSEIEGLLALLERHRALGSLAKLAVEDRKAALAEKAGRQLLVALHEATFGVPFEDILVDEYNNINPLEAQRLYLTVCVLNRLKVSVRAGIVARIHGIPFSEFKARLFSPLEHVVFAEPDPATRDYAYRARHPLIADIVFQRILSNPEERFDVFIKCLKALNVSYSADWKAFWQMVRGRALLDMFPDHQMVTEIFKAAQESVGDDGHLIHQMALYEMHRPNGNSAEASRLLTRASQLASRDVSIKHSAAEFKLKSVDTLPTRLEREKSLKDAASIARELVAQESENAYAHHTLVKVGIKALREGLAEGEPDDALVKRIQEVETQLFVAAQQFPGDSYLLESEAELAKLLRDDERALKSMKKAFDANPRNSYIALRLADIHESSERVPDAMAVLKRGLEANNSDKRLHFKFGRLLMKSEPGSNDELIYHFRRSFTDGDSNFDGQLLYARQLYLSGDMAESRKVFGSLSKAHIAPQTKSRLLYPIEGERFSGKIWKIETAYGFISRDGAGDSIFMHASNVAPGLWKNLTVGTRVRFSIAFTFKGASAFDVEAPGLTAIQPRQIDLPLNTSPI